MQSVTVIEDLVAFENHRTVAEWMAPTHAKLGTTGLRQIVGHVLSWLKPWADGQHKPPLGIRLDQPWGQPLIDWLAEDNQLSAMFQATFPHFGPSRFDFRAEIQEETRAMARRIADEGYRPVLFWNPSRL